MFYKALNWGGVEDTTTSMSRFFLMYVNSDSVLHRRNTKFSSQENDY